jgi:hypothetical protein
LPFGGKSKVLSTNIRRFFLKIDGFALACTSIFDRNQNSIG